ncbi:hypothetical protein AGABI1DRAFT_114468 [Agaricus bisporus var. burnettii JB137-S8]|uniref:tyrosinase n=1 Tax=Agaricus bisporus var. burnettii (strain JB137-S8 / ATCC MYA-4627 / FGSC 10392) TaxID=597362 RepID=K5XUX5_AGABU|nr:uncharacterized protein AGABI1DRAFT_114468 [Agaricus bisporus var. burnettii JB137-S8]EKM78930.1 hypothetical protein AGABI1DRAFT_114468 [Agaricus bisporus var. burnettii JB137-S8]
MSLLATVGPTGGVKNRLDIVDFVRDEKFFTLYVRALQAIQDKDQADYSSFFQLSGIHGLPFTPWAKPKDTPTVPYESGYCTHSQVLFPTWHRVYVSIYEQVLQEAAKGIAKKFTVHKKEWAQAAEDLRQPYWDTGFALVPPDEIIKLEQVKITNYDGTKITVRNPILRYSFHPIDPSFNGYPNFDTWRTTVRNPDADKKENIPALIAKLDLEADSTREKTYNMLKFNANWEAFSNHGEFDDTHANSLEAVHDDIHGFVGRGAIRGHMTHALFAFDPIFWLHHSNVDRHLSLWQALYPGVWVTQGPEREGSMGFAPGTELNKDSALEPFYETEDKPWTSVPLTDTALLNYSYPDFDKVKGGTPDLVRDYINDHIDRRYGIKKSEGGKNPALDLLSDFKGVTHDHNEDLKMFDWTIQASWKKFELDDSFAIIFYFAADGSTNVTKENYIGSINIFRGTTPTNCANCRTQDNLVQEGFVHLDRFIARDLDTFDPQAVHRYLKEKKLSYKVVADDHSVTLKSLKIRVQGRPLHLPPGVSFPRLDKNIPIVNFDDVLDLVTGVVNIGLTAVGATADIAIGVVGATAGTAIGVADAATDAVANIAKGGLGALGRIF